MANKKNQKLTCTFFLGGKQVDKLPEEWKKAMSERLSETMSCYYSQHPEEYKQF